MGNIASALVEVAEQAIERMRVDAYFSDTTGLGRARDKGESVDFTHARRFLTRLSVSDLYAGDPIAARIVDMVPDEAMMRGWHLEFSSANADGTQTTIDPGMTADLNARIRSWEKRVNLYRELNTWYKRGRAHGGAILVFGVQDSAIDKSLPIQAPVSFDWLRTLTRWEVSPSSVIGIDPKDSATFCKPVSYALHPARLHEMLSNVSFHASRVLRYDGILTDDPLSGDSRGLADTFGDSIFERVWIPLRNWNSALQGAGHIIQDFAQSVYAVKGFRQVHRAKGGKEILLDQFRVMDQFRSMFNATVIDADDTYERKTTSVAGMSELIDRFAQHLSAASGMALTRLIGISPGGFGTGESESDDWALIVKASQQEIIGPALEAIYSVLFQTPAFKDVPDTWRVVFDPLDLPSEKEQADIRYTQAQADALNIQSGIVTPDEVARARFGSGGFSLETQVDQAARDEMADTLDVDAAIASTGAPGTIDVAKTALNGAQISSILAVITGIMDGTIPRDSAIAILQTALQLSREEATAIVGSAKEKPREAQANAPAPNF